MTPDTMTRPASRNGLATMDELAERVDAQTRHIGRMGRADLMDAVRRLAPPSFPSSMADKVAQAVLYRRRVNAPLPDQEEEGEDPSTVHQLRERVALVLTEFPALTAQEGWDRIVEEYGEPDVSFRTFEVHYWTRVRKQLIREKVIPRHHPAGFEAYAGAPADKETQRRVPAGKNHKLKLVQGEDPFAYLIRRGAGEVRAWEVGDAGDVQVQLRLVGTREQAERLLAVVTDILFQGESDGTPGSDPA